MVNLLIPVKIYNLLIYELKLYVEIMNNENFKNTN